MTGSGPENGPHDQQGGDGRQARDHPTLPSARTLTSWRVVFITLVALALAVGILSLFVGGVPTGT